MRARVQSLAVASLTLALALALALATPACAPDESSVGGVFPPAAPGLVAEYFDGRAFQRPSGVYQDPDIDFEGWALNARLQARGHFARTVSIRWTGQIWLAHAEAYALGFELRGRVRLWLDGALVIDDWTDGSGGLREARGTLPEPGGGWRDLRVEWDQIAGPMDARLRFQSASQPRAVVPASALRHPEPAAAAAAGAALAADDGVHVGDDVGDGFGELENAWDLPLSAVTATADTARGTVVGGVSSAPELFWDAWLVPSDGGAPRRLAPIGLTLLSVNAAGALWADIARIDDTGDAFYELRLSPADGSPSVIVAADLPAPVFPATSPR